MKRAASISICALVFVASVSAHAGHEHTQQEVLSTWTFDPLVVLALAFSAVLYSIGIRNLWREAGTGSAVSVRGALLYVCGWLSLFVALVSPVHAWGEVLFSAHMTQHEILMLISAPLIVLGRPLIAFMWALPRDVRKAIGDMTKTSGAARVWSFLTNPTAAFLIHGFALWIWHIPYLFQATLESDLVHTFQHVSFFGSGLLFWWSIIYGRQGIANYGLGVLYLFITSLHSGILGAFLTFTRRVWYPIYSPSTAEWGLSPVEDQQLGGLIMWVPAGLVYIGAALIMFAAWIHSSERLAIRREEEASLQA